MGITLVKSKRLKYLIYISIQTLPSSTFGSKVLSHFGNDPTSLPHLSFGSLSCFAWQKNQVGLRVLVHRHFYRDALLGSGPDSGWATPVFSCCMLWVILLLQY